MTTARGAVCATTPPKSEGRALASASANATASFGTQTGVSTTTTCRNLRRVTLRYCIGTASEYSTAAFTRPKETATQTSSSSNSQTRMDSSTRSQDSAAMPSACTKRSKVELRNECAWSRHLHLLSRPSTWRAQTWWFGPAATRLIASQSRISTIKSSK